MAKYYPAPPPHKLPTPAEPEFGSKVGYGSHLMWTHFHRLSDGGAATTFAKWAVVVGCRDVRADP
jgi:hypothetical protein